MLGRSGTRNATKILYQITQVWDELSNAEHLNEFG